MKLLARSFLIGSGCLALGFFTGAIASDTGGKGIVRWAVADLKWQPVPGVPVMVAPAWSHANGSHCDFNKFPKGTKVPLHSHTAELGGVVLAGQFGSAEEGATARLAGPGSYQFIPGGLKHTTECGADADCVVFACQPAAFDLVEAGGAKK